MITAAQIRADIQARGGDTNERAPRRPRPSERALLRLAQEYPDRYRELLEEELSAARRRVDPDRVDSVRKLAARGLTDTEIAARLSVCRSTIQKLRRANGIPPGLGRVGRPGGFRAGGA